MGRTMTLKDDFGVTAWGTYLGLSLLSSLFSPSAQSDVAFPKDHHFSWKAGQWGQCVGEECGSGGVQTRTLWCVHVEGWTTHHSRCPPADRPDGHRHCFKVCDWHQDLFEWDSSDWGACVLVPSSSSSSSSSSSELRPRTPECVTAQHGVQRRRVHCVRASNRTAVALRICQFFSQRPPAEQACLIPCPQDCVVSDFTAWSVCGRACGGGGGLQHRTRHVLAAPMYGGAECPALTQTRACSGPADCPAGEGEHRYSLKVGAWSECRPPNHKDAPLSGRTTLDFGPGSNENNTVNLSHHHHHHHHHHLHHRHRHHHHPHNKYPMSWELEVGYRTRQVRCTRSDGKNAMLSLCTKDSSTVTFQACVMPVDCQTSDWSLWSPCSKTCQSTDLSPGYRLRSRTMTQLPVAGGQPCPALEEKEACNIIGDLLPKCPRYAWRSTAWGECGMVPLLSQQARRQANTSALCGGGIQTRKTYCVQARPHHGRDVSRPVDGRLCAGEEPPSAVQECSVPCRPVCLLSQWAPWGACLHHNCKEPQGKRGFRQRSRELLWVSGSPPESCPHLTEALPCDGPPSSCPAWQLQRAGAGAGCVPSRGSCGPGTQDLNVTCVSSKGEELPSLHCVEERPATQRPCEVPCPADCVVGPWEPWTPCSLSCATKAAEGRQSRSRTVLAIPGKGGKACPAAAALEEWRQCGEQPCVVFHWEASAWGSCIQEASLELNTSSTSTSNVWNTTAGSCAVGVQIRKVSCVKLNVGPVISKRCLDATRPDSVRPCVLPCQTDCIVTPFSEWTACPSTCVQDNTTASTQSRHRTIIQRPANGGQECPDTLFEERDCESLPVCPLYRWRTHKWTSCALVPEAVRRGLSAPGEACGDGLETRGVSCVGESDEAANMTECLRWAGPVPPRVRGCRVACKDDCTLSAWSKFSECSGCGSRRSRRRSLTGRSKKKEHCLNEELYPLEDSEACPCEEFLSQPYGNWSACVLPARSAPGPLQGWRSQREVKECGQGLRYRAVACIHQQGHLVDPGLCTDSGYTVEVCHVPCPSDCKLSDWSAWSACSASCGSGLKMRSKWLREKAFNGGRPCPRLDLKNQVYEAVRCHSECSQYQWSPGPWSLCTVNTVDQLPGCGEGAQSRTVRCVKEGAASGEPGPVDDSLCDLDQMPPTAQQCFLACPNHCVTAPWGPWSDCPLQCEPGSERNRSRHVLRPPAPDQPPCPELLQSEPCVLNRTCFTYQHRLSDWSTCQLSENAICGLGSRLRLLDCVRSDGRVVELGMCEQHGLVNERPLSERCAVDCPVSCLLSDWSAWAECSHTCGSRGQSVRTRRVLREAHEEGRPCPGQLIQTRACPIRPCYTWLLSDWSPCTVEDAECGEGLRRRQLSCVVSWGDHAQPATYQPTLPALPAAQSAQPILPFAQPSAQPAPPPAQPVPSELCGDFVRRSIQQEMERPCFVPCLGDCHLTVWSSWSSCQLTCLEGRSFEPSGRQARSRAVIVQVLENQGSCPQQVYETQPCTGGKCHTYQWRAGAWSNNERAVWCQRSDGVNVTGGCFPQKRPTTVRHCHPPCAKPFSHCTPSGVCGCEKGYTEVMTTHGFLDYCTRTPGPDSSKKADVKTNAGRSKPGPSQTRHPFSEWTLRPVGPDGRVKLWVYAVTAVGFILILFIIALSFLVCTPSKTSKASPPPQKPLTLAYDGDVDM